MAGDPIAAREAAEEGRDLADAIGDRLDSRQCRWVLGLAQWASGDLAGAVAQLREVVAEADAAHDVFWRFNGLFVQAHMLAYGGDVSAARAAADAAIERRSRALGVVTRASSYCGVGRRGPRRGRRCRGGRRDRGGLARTSVSSPRWRQSVALTLPRPRWRAAI